MERITVCQDLYTLPSWHGLFTSLTVQADFTITDSCRTCAEGSLVLWLQLFVNQLEMHKISPSALTLSSPHTGAIHSIGKSPTRCAGCQAISNVDTPELLESR